MASPYADSEVIQALPRERPYLLDNLGALRRACGPIDPDLSDALADHMGIRRGEVAEVVSFYSYLGLPADSLRICTGPMCVCRGARELLDGARRGARNGRSTIEAPCLGHCDLAPVATLGDRVLPGFDATALVDALGGAAPIPVSHRANDGPSTGLATADETLEDYERRGGLAVLRALPTADAVLAELEVSQLRGLGGAGFPTARKWAAVLDQPGPRVVVVNADEGEPGTVKDRYLMELRPHLLLEGMLIAMRLVDAPEGYVYLREEYATARARLARSLDELREARLLEGLSLRIVVGAGSYVCGEETAMLESMEGRRGMPRLRPPFPAQSGLLGRPTLVNNVETLAHFPAILANGGAWFAALGRRGSPGVRLFSLSGAVALPGCYEAPNGTTIRELVDEYGGGATDEIGAIVPGGAASGILPPSAFDVPLTDDALREWGAAVGSAGVQVFPASFPLLSLLEETQRFFAEESCQKCTPCRIGTRALRHVVAELEAGRPAMTRSKLDAWVETMERGSICGLGQTAPLPLLSALRHWPDLGEALQ